MSTSPTRSLVLRAALGLLAAVGLTFVWVAWSDARERQRTVEQVRSLQADVYAARTSADSCRNELAWAEGQFRRFDEHVDSLRTEVRAFEALDERGVPAERYEEYLELFDGYNDSVAAWERRADELRAAEEVCRALVEGHNTLSDSLRRRIEAEGLGGG